VFFFNHSGLKLGGVPSYVNNVQMINCGTSLDSYNFIGEVTLRNLVIINGGTNTWYMRANNYTINIVDSVGDINNYNNIGYDASNSYLKFKTTFSTDIENSANGTMVIYDKDNNIIYQEDLLSNEMSPQELEYQQRHIERDGSSITKNEVTIYQPFKLVVTKYGYDDLVISNIYVTSGQPTIIRGEMVIYPTKTRIYNSTLYNTNIY